ncbi:MAG: aldehyde ferredoxin oxidoreductase family protein [Planctomycetaceae bacterium]|nr:aldehyde ferredoxin oxidoreductase family protein [Planctomycetaceae bacterium]
MSDTPHGYHGRYLHVDLSTQRSVVRELPADVLQQHIGGSGLGTWLLQQHTPHEIDPLTPDSPLLFVFSPLIGSPLTTSAKFAVMAKSPLTQRINDSLSSSHFAIAGKKTGHDAIVITGHADSPACLIIEPESVRFESADDVWGLSSQQAANQIRIRLGKQFHIASIGPAGEHLVRYATISNDGRHAGRGGLGAVMGSKNLKAVAVTGDRLTTYAHSDELIAYSKDLSRKSFGPATAKYRELGTVSNLLTFNRLGTLPTRNFQQSEFAEAERLAPETMSVTHDRTRASCAACTIGCEHIFHVSPGDKGVRMEYENLFALGPLCGISHPDTVLCASALCDELGLDTISAGGTIAFAMECAERGLIDAPDLRFGNGDALLQTLHLLAHREGLGDLLAEGSRLASQQIGQGSEDFAPHVKGLELPGYEPRTLQTMALGFAVGTRGADHNRSGAYQVDFSDKVDRLLATPGDVTLAIETENEAALMDSLILCKFLRGVFDDRLAAMAEMLHLVTGWDIDVAELQETATRIVNAKKDYNIRQGWTPDEDTLPKRFLTQAIPNGESAGAALTEETLKRQIEAYNLARGWTPDGYIFDHESAS